MRTSHGLNFILSTKRNLIVLTAPRPSQTAPKHKAARVIHINMQVTSSVLRKVFSITSLFNLFLNNAAKVAVVAPTAELSTKLVTPITNRPVMEKKISKGRIPARRSLNFLLHVIFSRSCFESGGPRFG